MTTTAQSEKQFILTFNHKTDETPTVRYGASPDHLFIMARRVVAQYPAATWFIVRRSDGVCIAQSKAPTVEPVQQQRNLEQRIARLVLRNPYATPAKVAKLIMAEIAR